MKRSLKTIDLGKEILIRVVFESQECIQGTGESRYIQFELLKYIADDPSLTACGYSDFQTLKMWHDGFKWIVEAEAKIPSP